MEIGVDIIEINRIKKACQKRLFQKRFFTENELCKIEGKKNYYAHLAGKFAAKEAVVKAMGTGFRNFKFKDIEILNEVSGKPKVVLSGNAKKILKSKGFCQVKVTISHSMEYAVAFAIAIGGARDESNKSYNNEKAG